jgi:tRNA (guanine37-N1)-methyltransferase
MGNPDSLVEESHEDGLLEYPVFTKPAEWRGLDVPPVLLSGNHKAIAQWRHDQAVRRTADRRPDLLHGSAVVGVGDLSDLEVRPATRADAAEIFTLQRACWLQELQANPEAMIPPLAESLDDVIAGIAEWTTHVVRAQGRLIASCRGRLVHDDSWDVGRLMVVPDLQGRGLGRWLLEYAESQAPAQATRFELFTGANSTDNLRMYRKAGYRLDNAEAPRGAVHLSKRRR